MKLAIDAPPPHTLTITGRDERFPVNRVFCVGRNCAAHGREMGKDPDREAPFFFMKPAHAVVDAALPTSVPYPTKTRNYHHEIRRDLQLEARDKGRPWEFGKSFAPSAPVGTLHRAQDIGHPASAAISVTVNGQPRQASAIAKLIWSVSECVAYLSEYEALEPGDIIMTGTPEGVNAVVAGDVMHGQVQGLGTIEVRVTGGRRHKPRCFDHSAVKT